MRTILVTLVLWAGCSEDVPPAAPLGWDCPAEWVALEQGGCAPAVLACAEGGGGLPAACGAIDLGAPRAVTDEDGEVGSTFWRDATGAIRGGWTLDGTLDGPPAADWSPDAGIDVCPEGWARDGDVCLPSLRTDCPAGSAALPDGTCTATGADVCPAGEWPGVSGTGADIHVRAGADPAAADGTAALPYATIAAALTGAPAGARILLAAGTYAESLSITSRYEIHGVCAARTVIAPSGGRSALLVSGRFGDVLLRGVTVRGGEPGPAAVGGGHLTLSRVRVEGAVAVGVHAENAGSVATLDDVSIVATARVAGDFGVGLDAVGGAAVEGTRVAIADVAYSGAYALDAGSRLVLTDCAVRGVAFGSDGQGRGVQVQEGASAELTRCVIERATGAGVFARAGSRAVLTDVLVRDVAALPTGNTGVGIAAGMAGEIEASRVFIDRCHQSGVLAVGEGSLVTLDRAVIRDTLTVPDLGMDLWGIGISVFLGRVVGTGVIVEGSKEAGVLVGDADGAGAVELTSSIVRGTRGIDEESTHGEAIVVAAGTALVRDVLVDDSQGAAIVAQGGGSTAELDHAIVRNTRVGRDGTDVFARGVVAHSGGSITARRLRVTGEPMDGVLSLAGGRITLEDAWVEVGAGSFGVAVVSSSAMTVRRSLVSGSLGSVVANDRADVTLLDSIVRGPAEVLTGYGRGLEIGGGSRADVRRVLVTATQEAGIAATLPETTVTLRDVIVDGVQASSDFGVGFGVAAFGGPHLDVERLAIHGVAGAGLVSAPLDVAEAGGRHTGSIVQARDVAILGVRTSTISYDDVGNPSARSVAYGLHAGDGSVLAVERAAILDGGFGLYSSAGSQLALHTAVIRRQVDAAGATEVAEGLGAPSLAEVDARDNADDRIVVRADLPEASALPAPTSVCVDCE